MANVAQTIQSLFQQVDEARTRRSMSWQALSRETGVSPGSLTRFIAGENPSLQNYLRLQEFVVIAEAEPPVDALCAFEGCRNAPTHWQSHDTNDMPIGVLYCEEHAEDADAFKDYTPEQRDKMAESGEAMPDGSYPIADCEDLSNAIQAIGRAKDPDATKAHIKKRAGALDCPDVELPEDWAVIETVIKTYSLDFDAAFTVTGSTDMPVADRDHDWDGLAAKDRIFDAYTNEDGKVDVDKVSKAFLRKEPDGDPNLKGTWALGYADLVGGELSIIPAGVAAVAGGHGIGKLKGLSTDEVQQLKNKCCDLYEVVSRTHEDWPACPFTRDNKNDKQVDEGDDAVAASAALGQPIEGIIAIEGAPTGDGRMLERGSVKWDEEILPIPLIWDRDEGDHSGMTVGSIHEVWRDEDDIWGKGFLSSSEDPETRAAVARVAELFDEGAVGVSIALDGVEAELRVKHALVADITDAMEGIDSLADLEPDADGRVIVAQMSADDALDVTTSGMLRHVAVVDTAAIAKAKMRLVGERTEDDEVVEIAASGTLRIIEFESDPEAFADPRFGAPGQDPRLMFDPHNNRWSVPPTVDAEGRVFGHIAPWGICLRGRPDRCITPPNADLSGFMRAAAPMAGGLRTGTIVVGGSHSSTGIGADAATRHYDKTGRVVADVRVGVDAYGIWFAGRLRPGASPEDIYAFKASDVSGHWEVGKGGAMTLCGLPAVNVGGFPKGYLTAEEVAMAASAALEAEDCGCESDAEVLEVQGVLMTSDDDRLARLEATIDRIAMAVAPLYAEHLSKSIPDED